MPLPTKKIVVPRKNYQRQIRTYTVMTLLVLIVAGVYGFFQYQKLAEAKTALSDGQTNLSEMQAFESQISGQYTTLNAAFYEDFRDVRDAINGVMPEEENYTKITQNLDAFVIDLNRKSPSIFMSNLKFSKGRLDKENGYAVLPFTMTLSTSRDNFERMLQYAENSGSLENASRLLDVRSITLNFPGQGGTALAGDNLLDVSLSVNAYFQLPTDFS